MYLEDLYHLCLLGLRHRRVQGKRDGEVAHLVHETGDSLTDIWKRPYGRSESQVSVYELLCDLR